MIDRFIRRSCTLNKDGLVYRLDPRTKILIVTLTITSNLFLIDKDWAGLLVVLLTMGLLVMANRVRHVAVWLSLLVLLHGAVAFLVTMKFDLDLQKSFTIVETSMYTMFSIILLIIFMVSTINIGDLLKSLERMRVPRVITVPFGICFRFIPTFIEEKNYIKDALKARGINLSPVYLLSHPFKSMEYFLVPLLFRSMTLSDELACSAATRAIEKKVRKGSLRDIRLKGCDFLFGFLYMLLLAAIVILNRVIDFSIADLIA